jgi:two-component system sensor histidine kinase BaeS
VILDADKERVSLDFQDTAPGVPPEALPRLFDRLYRVEGSRSRDTGGTGLGLAICRNIVEAHGGQISARAAPQGGLWIHIELPL